MRTYEPDKNSSILHLEIPTSTFLLRACKTSPTTKGPRDAADTNLRLSYTLAVAVRCEQHAVAKRNTKNKGSGNERKKKGRKRRMIVRRHGILPRRSNGRDKFNWKVCGRSCHWRTSSASSTFRHRLIRDSAGKKWNYVAGLCTWPHSVATGDNWASCVRQKRFSPECQRRFEMAW